MQRPSEVEVFADDKYEVVGDARFFPLLFTINKGEPTIPVYDKLLKWRNTWLELAAAQGTKVYLIAYAPDMRPPNAIVRKHMAESIAEDKNNPGFLGTGVVVPNALLRGVVTAISWIAGKEKSGFGDNSPTLEEGILAAFRAYDYANLPRPKIDPKAYELPTVGSR